MSYRNLAWSVVAITVASACEPSSDYPPLLGDGDGGPDATLSDVADVGDAVSVMDAEMDATSDAPADVLDAANDVPDMDGPSDAPADAPNDGGSDAATDAGCLMTPANVTPPAQYRFASWTDAGTAPPGAFGCPLGATILSFALSSPANVTVQDFYHTLSPPNEGMSLVGGCNVNDPVLTTVGHCQVDSKLVGPGTYTWVRCNSPYESGMYIDPVTPPPSNASCGSPAPLNPTWSEPRILDGQPRTYVFTSNSSALPSNITLNWAFNSGLGRNSGRLNVSVRTDCNNPATEVAKFGAYLCGAPTSQSVGYLMGTYYVVVTPLDRGISYEIGFSK